MNCQERYIICPGIIIHKLEHSLFIPLFFLYCSPGYSKRVGGYIKKTRSPGSRIVDFVLQSTIDTGSGMVIGPVVTSTVFLVVNISSRLPFCL